MWHVPPRVLWVRAVMIYNSLPICFLAIVASSLFIRSVEAKKIPRWWLKVAQNQGPNACVVEEVPGSEIEFWTECRYWLNRQICGQKTQIRFECCEGFEQIEGETGCILVKPLRNILETAESLGATKWVQYIRESGLESEFESSGAYTLFAPTNEAFDEISGSLRSQLDSYRGNPNNPIIMYHIVPSKVRSDDFVGDQTVETKLEGNNIRINKYSNGMTTINCAMLLRKDQEATNGVVHLIDGFLFPSAGISNNVADLILNDGRFQVLASMLEKSGYVNVLRTLQGSMTILAPSDEAFQKLPDSRREKIINDREARLAILQNHVIPHVICESAITGEHKVRTLSKSRLTFNCDIDGAYVENTKMTGNFNLAKNGIVHLIDDLLLPDRAKNLVELAESRNLDTFVQLVKKSGLEETLSHTGDYTFFVPDETAWLEMPPEILARTQKDPEYAGLVLRYHGAYGRHLTNAIIDNEAIMSLDEEHPVRLQVWRKAIGVEDAKITDSDIEAQNGVIHIINKVIFPSNKSLEDTLHSINGYSFHTFLDLLHRTISQSGSSINLLPGEDRFYTFFVPTDGAFSRMEQSKLSDILTVPEKSKELLESHVARNMFPTISFEPGLIYSIDGIGSNFNIRKSPSGNLTVNGFKVIGSYMSANGVIHVIDDVLFPNGDYSHYTTEKRTYTSTRNGHTTTSTRTTHTTTHHQTVSHNDGFNNYLDEILPVYPAGSVIIGSEKRQTSFALPKSTKKITRRRGKRFRKRYKASNNIPRALTNKTAPIALKVQQPAYKDHKLKVEEIVKKTTRIIPVAVSNVESSVDDKVSVSEDKINAIIVDERNKSVNPSLSTYDRFNEDSKSKHGRYSYSGTVYGYPATVSGSRYSTHFTSNTNSSFPNKFGLAFNYSWPSPSYQSSNSSQFNLPLPAAGYNYSHSSSSFSSTSYFGNNNAPPSGSQSRRFLDSELVQKINTTDPSDSSKSEKFNYIGHPYGEDVVGKDSRFLPFSALGSTYVSRNSSNGVIQSQGENTTKFPPVTHRKRIHKTRTIYTYPSGKSVGYLATSTRILTFPDGERLIVATEKNKTHPNFVSAYAFTGDEVNFADGTEFSEARRPSEEVIMAEQAKILRRQWKKKRHHQRRPRNRRRRRMRKHRQKM